MSNNTATQSTHKETYGKYVGLKGAVANAIASFSDLAESVEFRAIGAIGNDEAGFVLGVDAKEGLKVVLFARAMGLTPGATDAWTIDAAIRNAFDKDAKAATDTVTKYTNLTKEGNLPKWATRDALVASLGKVNKKPGAKKAGEALATRDFKSLVDEKRADYLTIEQCESLLAVISNRLNSLAEPAV